MTMFQDHLKLEEGLSLPYIHQDSHLTRKITQNIKK